jgi:hypothetical protein
MRDESPRLHFRCDVHTLAQIQQLAATTEQSVSQVLRDAVEQLLANEPQYRALVMQRTVQKYKPPTPEQHAAAQRLIADAMAIDLSLLFASMSLPRDNGPEEGYKLGPCACD